MNHTAGYSSSRGICGSRKQDAENIQYGLQLSAFLSIYLCIQMGPTTRLLSSNLSKTLPFFAHCYHFITNQTLFQGPNMFLCISWVTSLTNFICTWFSCSSWPLSPCTASFVSSANLRVKVTNRTNRGHPSRKERKVIVSINTFICLFPACSLSRTRHDKLYFIRLLHLHASGAAAFGACPQRTACKWLSHEIFKETLMPVAHEDEFQ